MVRSLSVTMLLLFLVGCGADDAPTTAPATAPGTRTSSATGDAAGLRACDLLKRATEQATLMDPGVVAAIKMAGDSADAPVAAAAGRLATAYTTAIAAQGSATEPDAVAAVSAAGVQMTRACTDAGLETAG